MKDDGSLGTGEESTPLQKLFLARRSHRRFAPGAAGPEQIAYIRDCVDRFAKATSFESARIVVVEDEAEKDAIVRASMKGLVGKINPWLPFMKARQLVMCGAIYDPSDERSEIERAVKQASMAMQVAILGATEVGLATCWLAGINHESVERVYRMPDGARLVAMSPLGVPASKKGLSWDALTYHLISKRRKPLEAIWMREVWSGAERKGR